MKKPAILTICLFAFLGISWPHPARAAGPEGFSHETCFISGVVQNAHRDPVPEVRIRVLIDGQPRQLSPIGEKETFEAKTSSHETFQLRFALPPGTPENQEITVEAEKTGYRTTASSLAKRDLASKDGNFYAVVNLGLSRALGTAFYVATAIFLLTYILISFEILHRTLAALFGAGAMLLITYTAGTLFPDYHIISFERAVGAIDMNVIFLLMGMMIIVGILKNTGVFQWCAYQSYRVARGRVTVLSLIFCFFVAFTSAFLDNVTTMLLFTPVTIEISLALKISPLILLLPEVMASNVGGTATLIGDPPNIMIGSYAGLDFMAFVKNLTLVCIVAAVALAIYNRYYYRREYSGGRIENPAAFLARLKEECRITDRAMLSVGLVITGLVIALFITHGYWHMPVSIPALFGAGALFIYAVLSNKVKMLDLIEKDIEWSTLLFFMFLFIVVGAVEETGLLAVISDAVLRFSQGNLTVAICLILWVSAIMSAFIDNIPFVATMLPITAYLSREIPGAESHVLWWALALGACLGGNGTLIGASANVVTMGIAEKAGHPIRFLDFMKYACPYMLISVAICNVWLLIFY